MSGDWKELPARPGGGSNQPRLPIGPVTSPRADYVGRVIIEAFKPSGPQDDGIAYLVDHSFGHDPAAADRFALELIEKLQTRIKSHRW